MEKEASYIDAFKLGLQNLKVEEDILVGAISTYELIKIASRMNEKKWDSFIKMVVQGLSVEEMCMLVAVGKVPQNLTAELEDRLNDIVNSMIAIDILKGDIEIGKSNAEEKAVREKMDKLYGAMIVAIMDRSKDNELEINSYQRAKKR